MRNTYEERIKVLEGEAGYKGKGMWYDILILKFKLFSSFLYPTSWPFVVNYMLTWMTYAIWMFWHFVNWTNLRSRFFCEILTVDRTKIMRSFVSKSLFRFIIFRNTWRLFIEVTSIGGSWIEFISIRIFDFSRIHFTMWVGIFFGEFCSISCGRIERLFIGDKLIIFDEDTWFLDRFRTILIEILWSWTEHMISCFIFNSWKNFFSHFWFGSWKIFTVFWVNVRIWGIWLCFLIRKDRLYGGGFFQVLIGCLV